MSNIKSLQVDILTKTSRSILKNLFYLYKYYIYQFFPFLYHSPLDLSMIISSLSKHSVPLIPSLPRTFATSSLLNSQISQTHVYEATDIFSFTFSNEMSVTFNNNAWKRIMLFFMFFNLLQKHLKRKLISYSDCEIVHGRTVHVAHIDIV